MLQDFTDDPALLKAAVQSFNPSVSMELQIADVNQRLPRLSGALPDSGVRSPGRDPGLFIQRMQEFYEEQTNVVTDARVGMTLTAFRGIAQAVAGLPGRKSLVWVSGAFPMATYSRVIQYSANPSNDPNRVRIENLYEDKLREADSILTDAQVAVYAVDARGLVGQLLGMAMQYGSPGATGVTFDARVMPPAPASRMKVGVDFLVDPSTISTEDAGGGKKLALEFHVGAYGADRKLAGQKDVAIKPTLKSA